MDQVTPPASLNVCGLRRPKGKKCHPAVQMASKVILFGPLIAALNTVYDRERRQIFGSHGLGFCQIRQRMSRTVAGHAGKPFSIADQTRAPPQRPGPPRQRGVGRDHTIILADRRPQVRSFLEASVNAVASHDGRFAEGPGFDNGCWRCSGARGSGGGSVFGVDSRAEAFYIIVECQRLHRLVSDRTHHQQKLRSLQSAQRYLRSMKGRGACTTRCLCIFTLSAHRPTHGQS